MSVVHHVDWGRTRIAYALKRSSRQKTLSIRVEPDGSVEVVAPAGVADERIATVVRKKAAWIVERRRRVEDVPPPPRPREFVSGETFMYFGRQYRLRVRAGVGGGVKMVGRHLEVVVPRGTAATEKPAVVRSLLVAWYRARASDMLPTIVKTWSEKIDVEPRSILVREPKRRWGSCDPMANVRLNWRIIQAPRRLIDYVVGHELVHLVHDDHGREFWAMLGKAMPDYEKRREALRREGPAFAWR